MIKAVRSDSFKHPGEHFLCSPILFCPKHSVAYALKEV